MRLPFNFTVLATDKIPVVFNIFSTVGTVTLLNICGDFIMFAFFLSKNKIKHFASLKLTVTYSV